MGTPLSGLASGFDWSSFIDNMMSIAQVPQNALVSKKGTLSTKSTALTTVRNLFSDLQSSLSDLKSTSLFQNRSATLANSSSTWTATADASTAKGEYTFNVTQLATAGSVQGATNIASPIVPGGSTPYDVVVSSMNLSQAVTAGDFTVNGVKISVATTDTLGDVLDRITTQAGVTATYDAAQDKISLTTSGGSPVTLGASNDTSNFLQALKLYGNGTDTTASTTKLGVVRTSLAVASASLNTAVTAVDGSGNGQFTINGVQIDYNVNTDSVQTVLGRINASTAGVTATYDATQGRFLLTNKSTGDLGITISESAGGLLGAMGLTGAGATTIAGKNAEFTVNNGPTIISRSNTLDDATHGITGLSVTARGVGSDTVTVGSDTTDARAAIDAFIKKYNTLQSTVDSMTKYTTTGTTVTGATLAGDRDLRDMARSLRSALFTVGAGITGSVKRLADLGIDFTGSGNTLSVKDSAKLDAALADNADDIGKFFSDATGGLGKRLDDILTKQLGDSGPFATKQNSISDQMKRFDTQIADWDRRLAAQRSAMENSFLQMENLQSIYQHQATAIENAFPSSNSSSGK
jgi:flagellar hook-associated protein 2